MMTCLEKIVSGGQTGADQAGLRWAMENGFEHGGWCPRGRSAENGTIPEVFHLEETPSEGFAQRTEWNVRDSDATVIFSISRSLTGGSLLTKELTRKWKRPCLHLSKNEGRDPEKRLLEFIDENFIRILNVAGPRETTEPNVGEFVEEVLSGALL